MTGNAYNPKEVEDKWTDYWFKHEVFDLDVIPDRPAFSVAIPPPNITGNLHLGHALNGTLQDILVRWKRMQGYNVLWQPGTDHAGISTQMVVERQLKKEGKNRHDLGREKFIEQCWAWRRQYGDNIYEQYRRLGVSFAWNRPAFTMDEEYVKAIYRVFVTLFREGKIYRGTRVNNWCPRCQTSLSDLEVEHNEIKGHLYHIRYVVEGESGKEAVTVATTRPESMFGDVAVAVNPRDDRYKSLIGKTVILPLSNRPIPVIGDQYVDMEFGTGALKITPAHDSNDWEIGQRHKLAEPIVIDKHGNMSACDEVPQQFHGMERFKTRDAAVKELEEQGLLTEVQDYVHGVGHCERCHTVLEPSLTEQWYLQMKELAEPAITAVEEERVDFIPARYASTYLDWMRNVRDWNISRQLWWGHRIPVWTCANGHVEAYEEAPDQCDKCDSKELAQDNDVLDTWFSSALWPFATLGWPEDTPEMRIFYPTTILSTAREIINLWVARMIFMSMKFAGTIPFKHVLIHPVIQTQDGRRMSKSKGNAVDPIDMIDKFGCDANRFWFTSIGVKGDQDVRFREERLEEYKRFLNKLWNAGHFILGKLDNYTPHPPDHYQLTLADRWILSRYSALLNNVHNWLRDYDFSEMTRGFYEFIWDYFCDWYLETAKTQLANPEQAEQTRNVLYYIYEGLMRAAHPVMPFFTEELWQKLPRWNYFEEYDSIMFAPFPRADERLLNSDADAQMELIMRVVRSVRNIRQTFGVPPKAEAEVILHVAEKGERELLEKWSDYIGSLAKAEPLRISTSGEKPKMAASETVSSAKVYVPLANAIDVDKTKAMLVQRKEATNKKVAEVERTLNNPDFAKRAPREKVDAVRLEHEQLQTQLESIEAQIRLLEGGA
jgi:valyl-tRNA synthetase